jgi:hypothetical protein
MSASKRADSGAAVAGLFARATATGGPARREHAVPEATEAPASFALSRVRQGVELTEDETGYLRSLSRTGRPRTLGSKFVATGVLAAAIELLRTSEIDMHGVAAGDLPEMTARAREALIRAASQPHTEEHPEWPDPHRSTGEAPPVRSC